jgi:hypothetical protein
MIGLPFAIIRPVAALITGITGGLITSVVTKNDSAIRTSRGQTKESKSLSQKLINVFRYGFVEFIQDISKWLVIGLVLAAIISALIPNDFFKLFNMSPVVQMLLVLIVSIPLYICATGSIPIAAILILKGLSPGAALVLLMAGPATNAATITMIGKVLGRKSLFSYLAAIIAGAIGFGLITDYVLPAQWFTGIALQHPGHDHSEYLSWWQISSGVVLTILIINGYIQKYLQNKNKKIIHLKDSTMEIKTIRVEGMTCNHCEANIESNLEKLSFVNKATANLSDKTVTIEGDNIEVEKAKEAVNSLGYKAV